MIKKLFGLASVTVLTGLVVTVAAAGCSATQTYFYVDEGGPGDGGKVLKPGDPGYIPPVEGGTDAKFDAPKKDATLPDEDGSVGGTCPTTTPITAADIDAVLLWKPPAAFVNVCTQSNIDALKNLFKASPSGVKYADIKTALGATCSACAFSPIAGAKWQVFVEDASGALDNRTGSCFAQRSGAACGRERFRWETCLDQACPDTDCPDQAATQACMQKAQKGACSALTTSYAAACPNETADLPQCGSIFGAIANSCSGGPSNTINITP